MKRIILLSVIDFDVFKTEFHLPTYAEFHDAESLYDENCIIVSDEHLLDMTAILKREHVRYCISQTYEVFEAGGNITTCNALFETNDLDELKEWLADNEGDYTIYKDSELLSV